MGKRQDGGGRQMLTQFWSQWWYSRSSIVVGGIRTA